MTEPLDDEAARALRGLWFRYLDTIAAIRPPTAAAELGLKPPRRDYHQDPETLARMIAGMRVPWQTTTQE